MSDTHEQAAIRIRSAEYCPACGKVQPVITERRHGVTLDYCVACLRGSEMRYDEDEQV
jgi:Zn ribbon nucleic-acid-binding protein